MRQQLLLGRHLRPVSGGRWEHVHSYAGHKFEQNGAPQFPAQVTLIQNVYKEAEADPSFNLHRPVLQTLPFAALTDDNFIILDGKSSQLL